MDQASPVQATIKGNVSGQVAIGSHILQMGDVNGELFPSTLTSSLLLAAH